MSNQTEQTNAHAVSAAFTSDELRPLAREYMPWEYANADQTTRTEQAERQHALTIACRGVFGQNCYVSPLAHVFADQLHLGDDSWIAADALVRGHVKIGARCTVNARVVLMGTVDISDDVHIAIGAQVVGFSHGYDRADVTFWVQPSIARGIRIEEGVWVGANVVIVDGVTIGAHSLLAAGAVVTHDVAPYSLVAGNPARVIRDRRNARPNDLNARVRRFAQTARQEGPHIIAASAIPQRDAIGFRNSPEELPSLTAACHALELAAAIGRQVTCYEPNDLCDHMLALQDEETGLFQESATRPLTPAQLADGIWTNQTGYVLMAATNALDVIGTRPRNPIGFINGIGVPELHARLDALPWEQNAWFAGSVVDAVGTAMYVNHHHFGLPQPIDALFAWLDRNCNADTGLWGDPTPQEGLKQPVNGFYRLCRGTYALFSKRPPRPQRAIDSILAYSRDPRHFGRQKGTSCDVLDVAHPLWLCRKHTSYREDDARGVAMTLLERAVDRWTPGQGMSFSLEAGDAPSLKYTEQWVAAIYYLCELCGRTAELDGIRPRGLHRPSS